MVVLFATMPIMMEPKKPKKLRLNVGGKIFITTVETIEKVTGSKLSRLEETDTNYDPEMKEYFFDRNPTLFTSILDYYRVGVLHFPHCSCPKQVRQELAFWEVDEMHVAECCQRWFQSADEYDYYSGVLKKWVEKMDEDDVAAQDGTDRDSNTTHWLSKWRSFRFQVWCLLEYPKSSLGAKLWAIFFLLIVLLSVTIQCGMTVREFRIPLSEPRRNITPEDNDKMTMFLTTELIPVLWHIDLVCMIVFCFDLVVRFIVCPSKLGFVRSAYNIIDIISTSSIVIMYVVESVYPQYWNDNTLFLVIYILSAFGVFRCLRLIKFAKQMNRGVKLLLLAIRASFKEIFLLLVLIVIGTLVFSNLIYFAEFYTDNEFHSIPIGFWWSIVTMTTVGYGDKHPNSGLGYVVGALCAVSGMLCTGLPIPIIANNFNALYTSARRRQLAEAREDIRRQRDTLNLFSESGISKYVSATTDDMAGTRNIDQAATTVNL